MSLAAYVKANPKKPGRPCSICNLPAEQLREVHRFLVERSEVSHQLIVDYLNSLGHHATLARLQGHIRQGHVPGYKKRRGPDA